MLQSHKADLKRNAVRVRVRIVSLISMEGQLSDIVKHVLQVARNKKDHGSRAKALDFDFTFDTWF